LQVRIAFAVLLEFLTCRAVVRETVALGDYSLLSPKKIDTVRADHRLKLERWKFSDETQTEHLCFENAFGLFGVEGPSLKDGSKSSNPGPSLSRVSEESAPRLGDCESLVDQKMFKNSRREVGRPSRCIEQSAKGSSCGYAANSFRREIERVRRSMKHCADDPSVSWARRCYDM